MSQILRKSLAEKLAFNFQPKTIETNISTAAKDFVEREKTHKSGFQIAEIVSSQSRVDDIRRSNVEAQVEETVLERIKEIQEDAYKQAYALGLQEGTDRAFEEKREILQEKLTVFDEILGRLDNIKQLLLKENEIAFVKMVFVVAEKLAMRSIEVDQKPILEVLTRIVEGMHKDDNITINLSESDMSFIEELRVRKVKEVTTLQNVKLAAFPDMKPSEFIVESNYGMIEATIPTRVEKVWDALKSKFPLLRGHKTDLTGKDAKDGKPDDSTG